MGCGIIVAGAIDAFLSGHQLSGPSLAFTLLAVAGLIVSMYTLLPSHAKELQKRFSQFYDLSPRERKGRSRLAARRGVLGTLLLLGPETAVGAWFWQDQEWQTEIVGIIGVTLLFLLTFLAVWIRTRVKETA